MKNIKGRAYLAFITAILLYGTSFVQAQSLQSITSAKVSPQSISSQRISPIHLSGGIPVGETTFSKHFLVEEVRGTPKNNLVMPPLYRNTFQIQAHYLTPNPKSESHPFLVKNETLRLPLPSKDRVYWSPNQTTQTFSR